MFRALLAIVLVLGTLPVAAQPAKKPLVTAATPSPDDRARQWLVLVDDRNYAQSWDQAGKALRARQTASAWAASISALRAPLGAMTNRDLKSIDLSRSNLAVIRYDTAFAHRAATVETLTLALENDGWSVTDYTVQ